MRSLEIDPNVRHASVSEWISDLEQAAADFEEGQRSGGTRLIILAPAAAEVYVDDERKASVGSSGRLVLGNIPPGQHILRVAKAGERDDERVIEIREGAGEQVIQAHLRSRGEHGSHPSPSQGSSSSALLRIPPNFRRRRRRGSAVAATVRIRRRSSSAGGAATPSISRVS